MECRETLVLSPLTVDFASLLHIQDTAPTPPPSEASEKRSLSWGDRHSSPEDAGSSPPTKSSTQPVFKVGSGEFNVKKKIKKNRPNLLTKHMEHCVENMITQQFNEEEAELATLSLDFPNQLKQNPDEISPRCPAPDPSAMQSRPKNNRVKERRQRRASLDVTISYPFGLRPRAKRKRRFLPPPPDLCLSPDEDSESESELSPPPSPSPRRLPVLKKSLSTETGIDIPTLDFGKLSAVRDRGSLLSPHASPPRSPSSPTTTPSKPDCAKYRNIESSPRSAFVKPSSA